MEPNRYRLRGPSLAQLGAEAIRTYGPDARIVSSTRISAGGWGRLMGRVYYEAEVEVAQAPEAANDLQGLPQSVKPSAQGSADTAADVVLIRPEAVDAARDPALQTPSERLRARGRLESAEASDEHFSRMMDDLWRALNEPAGTPGPDAGGPPRAPKVLRDAGALVVVAGMHGDAAAALQTLDADGSARVWDPSRLRGQPLHAQRRELRQVRAQAVTADLPVMAPAELEFPRRGVPSRADAAVIEEADQLWAAVDLRHKPDDVRVWLAVLAEHRTVDGVVLLAAEQTLTPDTGRQLGLPVHQP